jgi:hypothetical protein
MPYEVFTKKTVRLGTPTVSFSKIGQIAFNQTASRILQKETVELLLILWNAAEAKLAFKTTSNKKDPRAYKVRYNEKGNGASFSAKTFLDYAGIDYSERKAISIEINPNSEYIVEVQVPEELLGKNRQAQLGLVAKEKMG